MNLELLRTWHRLLTRESDPARLVEQAARCLTDEGRFPACLVEATLGGVAGPLRGAAGPSASSLPQAPGVVSLPLRVEGQELGAVCLALPPGMTPEAAELTLVGEAVESLAHALVGRARMRELEERGRQHELRSIFEQAGVGVAQVAARTGRFLRVNQRYCELVGYTADELLAMTWFDLTHPDSLEDDRRKHASLIDGTRQSFATEKRYRHKNGTTVWVKLAVSAVPALGGEPECHLTVVQDLTAYKKMEASLRRSEERYRSMVENLDEVVFSSDARGVLTYISSAVARFGFTPADMVGKLVERFVHPDDVPALEQALQRALGGTSQALEFRILDRAGKARQVRGSGRAILDSGRPVGISGVMTDLTQQRETEEQLRVAQKMEAVGRLAGGVAHDFNNLLSVINSYTEFAMEGLREGDPLLADLQEIRKAGQRAESLTRQLLAFSRKQVLQPVVLDLNELVAGIEKMLRRLIGEDVQLTFSPGAGLGLVKVDPGQIEQVLMNLAVNARDAMLNGGQLAIATTNVHLDEHAAAMRYFTQPGDFVCLSMVDTGCGMDDTTKRRIFEPFFTTKGLGKGTGLGLATVYGIVKQSGGSILFESEVGTGTRFEIYLPQAFEEAPRERPEVVGRSVRAKEHETILLVEDELGLLKVASRILGAAGYQVLAATSGEEALGLWTLRGDQVSLLLTDVVMPGMSGRELADRLTVLRPGLKVLYMSGYTDDAIAHRGVLEPGRHLIGKPFDAVTLTRKLRYVLDVG